MGGDLRPWAAARTDSNSGSPTAAGAEPCTAVWGRLNPGELGVEVHRPDWQGTQSLVPLRCVICPPGLWDQGI